MTKEEDQTVIDNQIKGLQPWVMPINRDLPPMEYADLANTLGISGPRVPAENLVDTHFIILGAKAYSSSFQEDKHVYFCVCKDTSTGEIFTTSLGGQAVVDILDACVSANFNRPLAVTLRHVDGGKFHGYYTLE
jgi:hypothetical protein